MIKQARSAFTLIELLMVIAVVAILLAVLVLAMGRVRQRADVAQCSSNLRQIGIVINLYTQDHNGDFPYGAYFNGEGLYMTWDKLLAAYWINPVEYTEANRSIVGQYVSCPSDTAPHTALNPPRAARTYAMVRASGRGIAGAATGGASEAPPVMPKTLIIPDLPNTLMLAEYPAALSAGDGTDNFVWGTAYSVIDSPANQLATQTGIDLHGGKFNYLFVDGHVEFLAPEETIGTGSMTIPNGPWTLDPND